MTFNKLRRLLMLAGVVPFIAGALAVAAGIESWWLVDDIDTSYALYCVGIASFMAGIYWGVAQTHSRYKNLLVSSILMVLLPWSAYLFLGDGGVFYLTLAYVFIRQLLLDRQLIHHDIFTQPYFRDRLVVAVPVSICMIIIAGLKFSN